jgi:hypothetical protein
VRTRQGLAEASRSTKEGDGDLGTTPKLMIAALAEKKKLGSYTPLSVTPARSTR